jgi:hypothetical protein
MTDMANFNLQSTKGISAREALLAMTIKLTFITIFAVFLGSEVGAFSLSKGKPVYKVFKINSSPLLEVATLDWRYFLAGGLCAAASHGYATPIGKLLYFILEYEYEHCTILFQML